MTNVFFSYASEDRDAVSSAAKKFRESGLEVAIDYQHITPGLSIPEAINEMIKSSDSAVVFYSTAYSRKPWTKEEQAALQFRLVEHPNFQLAVIRLDDAELPPLLAHRLWETQGGFARLADALGGNKVSSATHGPCSIDFEQWLRVLSDDDLERMATAIDRELRKSSEIQVVSFHTKKSGDALLHLARPAVERLMENLSSLLRMLQTVSFLRSRIREQIAKAGLGVFEGAFVLKEREHMQQIDEFRIEMRETLDALVDHVTLT